VDYRGSLEALYSEIGALYPAYHITIAPDLDLSD
jgi:hypothetical protein